MCRLVQAHAHDGLQVAVIRGFIARPILIAGGPLLAARPTLRHPAVRPARLTR